MSIDDPLEAAGMDPMEAIFSVALTCWTRWSDQSPMFALASRGHNRLIIAYQDVPYPWVHQNDLILLPALGRLKAPSDGFGACTASDSGKQRRRIEATHWPLAAHLHLAWRRRSGSLVFPRTLFGLLKKTVHCSVPCQASMLCLS